MRRPRSSNVETREMSTTFAHLQTAALSSSLFRTPERSSSWSVEMAECLDGSAELLLTMWQVAARM